MTDNAFLSQDFYYFRALKQCLLRNDPCSKTPQKRYFVFKSNHKNTVLAGVRSARRRCGAGAYREGEKERLPCDHTRGSASGGELASGDTGLSEDWLCACAVEFREQSPAMVLQLRVRGCRSNVLLAMGILAVMPVQHTAGAVHDSWNTASSMRATAESCYVAPALFSGQNIRHTRRSEVCRANWKSRMTEASSLCMSALTGEGDSVGGALPSSRQPEDLKWFVEPLKARGNPGHSYFQEIWGPVLEETRKKKALAAEGSALKPQNLDNTDADVQAMLDVYSDSDESELDERARSDSYNQENQPAPTPQPGTRPMTTPARPPSKSPTQKIVPYKTLNSNSSVLMAEAPRCGPRSSSPRGRAV